MKVHEMITTAAENNSFAHFSVCSLQTQQWHGLLRTFEHEF